MTSKDKKDNSTTDLDEQESDKRGTKRTVDVDKVHSANEWERADLGDEGRKSKFLRLMGATKKEHHGRFVIGDKPSAAHHGRSEEEIEKLTSELEEQYQQGLELKLSGGMRRHIGLGFQDQDERNSSETEQKCTDSSDVVPSESLTFDGVVEPEASDGAVESEDLSTKVVVGKEEKSDEKLSSEDLTSSRSNKAPIIGFVRGSSS